MAITKVVMPKLSEAMESGKIIKWLKKEGDRIQGGDILAEIETDKADVEMEAFGAGVLRKILVPAGESAPIGALIGVIADPADDISALLASAPAGAASAVAPPPRPAGAAPTAVAAAVTGPEFEDRPLSQIRAVIARRMPLSKAPVPHFYVTSEVAMDRAWELREQLNALEGEPKISVNDLVIRACALALL